jgi:hypothetical protein
MRARQRHLNPKNGGADIALDARFIAGLSNNSAVSTWNTRTNNGRNASQPDINRRPTYLTNQQGGNAVVSFNLDGMIESTGFNGSGSAFSTVVCMQTYQYNGTAGGGALLSCGAPSAFTQDFLIGRGSGNFFFQFDNGVDGGGGTVSAEGANTHTILYDGSQTGSDNRTRFFLSGVQKTLTFDLGYTVPASMNPSGGYAIGNYSAATDTAWWLVGNMCSISIYKLALSGALRRRIEHAAAYSFKMACS